MMGSAYTTICLRPRRGLRMNLRVRSVTGCSRSAIVMVWGLRSVRRYRLRYERSPTDLTEIVGDMTRWLLSLSMLLRFRAVRYSLRQSG